MRSWLARLGRAQQGGLAATIIVLMLIGELRNPAALYTSNLLEILRATSIYMIAACGATLLLVGGGLDLSIGSIFAAGGVAVGLLMNSGVPWPVAVLLAVAISGGLGLINALLIIYVEVPPFITTLGMYFAAGGLVTVVTAGNPRFGFPSGFNHLGEADVGGVPYLAIYALAACLIAHVALEKTRFGYDARALGGDAGAALANGVRVNRVKIKLYVISGAVAGLCGVLLTARLATADPSEGGAGFTFQVLAAVIIGGTSLFGGIGTILGTALGALLFSVINNVLALTNTDPLWENVATGFVLVAAVALDQFRRKRQFAMGRS